MSNYQRSNDGYQTKVHVAEITTGQLILYTCLVLALMAFVFGAGVIVGRVDHSGKPSADEPVAAAAGTETTQTATPAPSVTETYSVPAFPPQEGEASSVREGETASPQPTATETNETPVAQTGGNNGNAVASPNPDTPKPKNIFMSMTPRLTSMNPLPSNRTRNIQVEAPVRDPKPDTAGIEGEVSTTPPAETVQTAQTDPQTPAQQSVPLTTTPTPPTSSETPQKIPELTPITPEEPPIEDLPLEPLPTPQPETKTPTSVPAASAYKFGIQLVAFSGADRQSSAEALRQKVQKENGLQATVIPSEDDQYYRVVVVGYADRASADKALSSVRAKTGVKDAFVKPL